MRRQRVSSFGVFVLVALSLATFFLRKERSEKIEPLSALHPVSGEQKSMVVSRETPLPSAAPRPLDPAVASKQHEVIFPTLEQVREQIASDPHHTPPALIQFAQEIGTEAEIAKRSPEEASRFFGVLEDCMRDLPGEGAVPVAAQTLCLTNAEDLAKLFPSQLTARLQLAQERLSPATRKLREQMKRFQ